MRFFLRMLWEDAKTDVPMWIAGKLPRVIVYWCAIRLMAHATYVLPNREVDSLTPSDCLKAWKVVR